MSCLSAVASPLNTTMGNVHKYTKTWPGQIRISFHWPVKTLRAFLEMTARDATILDHKWTHSIYDSIIQASGLLKRTCFSLRRYTAFKRSIAPGRSWYLVSTIIGTNFAKHSASNCWVPSFIIWATSLGLNKIAVTAAKCCKDVRFKLLLIEAVNTVNTKWENEIKYDEMSLCACAGIVRLTILILRVEIEWTRLNHFI